MLGIFVALVIAYILLTVRSLIIFMQTRVKRLWLIIIVQSVLVLRGVVLLQPLNENISFLELDLLNQWLVTIIGFLGLISIHIIEKPFLNYDVLQSALKESESRFRQLINQSPLAVQIIDKDGLLIDANPAWERLWGLKREQLLHKYNLFEDEQLIEKGFMDLVEMAINGSAVTIPTSFYTSQFPKDRQDTRWLRGYLYALESEEIEHFALITEDVTQQVLTQEAFEESEDRWYQLVETYPEAILISVDHNFVYCNPASVKIFGARSKEEIIGRSVFHFNNEGRSKVLLERLARLGKGQSTPPVEHKMTGLDGIQRELISFSIPVSYHGKKAIQTIIRDVTQKNLNQRKLNRHEKLAAVGQLASGIAHDFNNALSVISLNAGLLLRTGELNEKATKRVELIQHQTERANSLTNQILDFGRRSVIHLETVNLKQFIEKIIELLKSILPDNISVEFQFSEEEQYVIEADQGRLQQLFINLAINSRDAMPKGGTIRFELFITSDTQYEPNNVSSSNKFVEIRILDNGVGIPDEIIPHLFEPFYTTKPAGKGTGLGLAQVYGIVSQHNGTIQINSGETIGTAVTINFPLCKKAVPAIEPHPLNKVENVGQEELILIVEDHKDSSIALADTLNTLNYKTAHANNGKEALDFVQNSRQKISIILSDVVMPILNGIELAENLTQMEKDIPIILMTGHPLSIQLDSVNASNIFTILQKPLEISGLSKIITSAINSPVSGQTSHHLPQ